MSLLDRFTDKGHYEFRVLVARSVIILVAVSLRFLCKLSRKEQRFGWDDFWILAACCLNYTAEGLSFWGLFRSNGGLSAASLVKGGDRKAAEDFLLSQDIGSMLWYLSMSCVCISIIAFYLRIFQHEDNFRRNAWILIALSGMWGVGSAVGGFLLCVPPSNFWKMKNLDKCGSYNTLLLSNSILEILITASILALPMKPVLRLSLSLKKRLGVLAVFLLGGFVIISGIIRIAIVYKPGQRTPDFLVLQVWSGIHMTAAVICACLPMYRPVWTLMSVALQSVMGSVHGLLSYGLRTSRNRSSLNSQSDKSMKKTESSSNLTANHVIPPKNKEDAMLQEYELWAHDGNTNQGATKA